MGVTVVVVLGSNDEERDGNMLGCIGCLYFGGDFEMIIIRYYMN